jgi:hypothetical protein
MNSSYISSSIFQDKNSVFILEEDEKIKSIRLSQAFKNVHSKDFTSKLGNLISTRDNLRKANLNPPATDEK